MFPEPAAWVRQLWFTAVMRLCVQSMMRCFVSLCRVLLSSSGPLSKCFPDMAMLEKSGESYEQVQQSTVVASIRKMREQQTCLMRSLQEVFHVILCQRSSQLYWSHIDSIHAGRIWMLLSTGWRQPCAIAMLTLYFFVYACDIEIYIQSRQMTWFSS